MLKLTQGIDQSEGQVPSASNRQADFAAALSHELRTPLNCILGVTRALMAKAREPNLIQGLGLVASAGEGLSRIAEDLVEMAAQDAGRVDLVDVSFDLGGLADDLAFEFGRLAHEKGLAFQFEIEADARGGRWGDPNRVGQIFRHLLSNAVKFTVRGSIRACLQASDGGITFSVADTGVGVGEAAQTSIFERFTRADGSRASSFGGLGLGLALAKTIIDRMGGDIQFDSRPGVGSIFVVDLPLAPSEAADRSPSCEVHHGLRVMVVDDNPGNRAVAEALLAPLGVAAVSYPGGAEAIDAWRQARWDLILMDIQMPAVDGVTAAGEIRRLEELEGRAHTPIVAFTANTQADEAWLYRHAGMDDVLAKPVRLPSLIAILNNYCSDGSEGAGRQAALAH